MNLIYVKEVCVRPTFDYSTSPPTTSITTQSAFGFARETLLTCLLAHNAIRKMNART